jgi:hypothetical protein
MATYLRIPYENATARESAKGAGAKWQAQSKLWKLDGDCPEALSTFKIQVDVATYSLESLISSRLEKPESLLAAVYEQADLGLTDGPEWQVTELVGATPLDPNTKFPNKEQVQSLARELAMRLLKVTGQFDLGRELLKVKG